jgi:hypothetical protein
LDSASSSLYRPAAHSWQLLPDEEWNLPAGQTLQAADASTANLPCAHAVHDAALYEAE